MSTLKEARWDDAKVSNYLATCDTCAHRVGFVHCEHKHRPRELRNAFKGYTVTMRTDVDRCRDHSHYRDEPRRIMKVKASDVRDVVRGLEFLVWWPLIFWGRAMVSSVEAAEERMWH